MSFLKQLNLLKNNFKNFCKLIFLIFFGVSLFSFDFENEKLFSNNLNEFIYNETNYCIAYTDSIAKNIKNKSNAIKFYELARSHYKKSEFFLEYYFPFLCKYYINSPLVHKAEYELGFKTIAPHGFQVIETYLYSHEVDTSINVVFEIELLKKSLTTVYSKIKTKNTKQATAIDMIRFELVRVMSLYLNGYDCTVNKQNLFEINSILESIDKTISFFDVNNNERKKIISNLLSCKNYLLNNKNYDTFNRLEFITNYLSLLYNELYNAYSDDDKKIETFYAINIRTKNFYDNSWFNKKYFSIVLKDSNLLPKQIELGKLLFFDPILSANNQRACASCHNPKYGFASNIDFNSEFSQSKKLKRNTPSLINVIFQKSFFVDGRSLQLEDQASDVINNHLEMFSTPNEIVKKLQLSPEYKKYFNNAFYNTQDTSITYYAILKSLSEYERSLISLNSKFDMYLKGNKKALTADEINGYNVFAGKGLCGSCHFFPLFNGLVPPFYADNEFEVLGTPSNKNNKELSTDSGRIKFSKNLIHLRAYKTPGIRNISETAPYMHNGIYETIDEVIDFYKKGGGIGLGLNVSNQTLPFDSLQLSKKEIYQLKKFILSLNDKNFIESSPKKLPNIIGYEQRKVGGVY